MKVRITGPFALVNTVLFLLAVAVAAVQWWPIYQDLRFIVVVAIAALAGALIAILGAVFRWMAAIVVLAGIVAFAVLGVALAVPDEAVAGVLPSLEGERQLFAGVALGWKQLLTITLPVGSYQSLLVPLFVVILTATISGLSAALRSRHGDLAALAPLAILVVGIIFGPGYARFPRFLSLSLLAVLLVWLVWRRWYRRRIAIARLTAATTEVGGPALGTEHRIFGMRTVVSGIVIVTVAAIAAVSVTTALPPSGARKVLRSSIEQPFDPRNYSSPLAGFRSYLDPTEANSVLFTVNGLQPGAMIRIATLDSYDGIVYSVGSATVDSASGSFTRVPFSFDQSAVNGSDTSLDVTIRNYSGVWMPTVGKLESVSFDGSNASRLRDSFYYNDTSGTAAVIGGLSAGDEYRLDARLPAQPTVAQLSTLTAGSSTVPPIGVLPDELELALANYTTKASGQGQQLAAMIDGLKTNGYLTEGTAAEPVRSGHSADRITQFLGDQGRMLGDAEQFAVTAALMARQIGFPARVVFGFAPTVTNGAVTDVTGSSVTAWLEVDTAQFGWVDINPTPAVRPIPGKVKQEPSVVARPPSIVQPPADNPPTADEQTPPESTQDDPTTVPSWLLVLLFVLRIVGFAALVIAILISPFLAVIGTKARRRRRRRRAATPVERISGGWQEYQDAVLDHGFVLPPSATRSELAASSGGAQAAVLAAVADRAVFAPEVADDDEADKVWHAVEDLRASLDKGATRWQRMRARVSLRSLGGGRLVRSILRRGGGA